MATENISVSARIGNHIRRLRKEKRLTIEALAASIQKGASTVSKYENGSISIDLDTLVDIAKVLNVEPQHLVALATADSSGQSFDESFNYNIFFRNRLQPSKVFMYQYDGRIKRIVKSILDIVPNEQEKEINCSLHLDVPDFAKADLCRYFYTGKMFSYDTIIYFFMTNPFNPCGRISVCAVNPYYLQHLEQKETKFYGLFSGFSFRPFTPFSSKVILSLSPLREDEDLMESLTLSKDDFKSIKKYNFMLLDPEEY